MTDKGKLKNVRLTRAENLSEAMRKEHNLPDNGLVIVETRQVPDEEEEKIREEIREGGLAAIHANIKSKITPSKFKLSVSDILDEETIVEFKSTPENFENERSGVKPNTFRKMDEEDFRLIALRKGAKKIAIVNTKTAERFEREITNLTEYEGWAIISWKHNDKFISNLADVSVNALLNAERTRLRELSEPLMKAYEYLFYYVGNLTAEEKDDRRIKVLIEVGKLRARLKALQEKKGEK